MAQFDFPASPAVGDTFLDPSSGASYRWNGYAWMGGAGGAIGSLLVSDNPPAAPPDNSLWWESDTGNLYLRFNDGNSTQWVQINNVPAAPYQPITGVIDGSNALAGQIGEVISSNVAGNAVALATTVAANVTSIVVPPGDWDIDGEMWITPSAAGATSMHGALTFVSAQIPPTPTSGVSRASITTALGGGLCVFPLRPCRASVTVSTTYYLVGQINFGGGSGTAGGSIIARRVR